MADSRAYKRLISPIGSGENEGGLVHQVSPAWVLTFVRWNNRDTFRIAATANEAALSVREPLVVENDCLQVTTSMNKGTLTPQMSATLIMTDVNYETAVAPGDFVFVNMVNWDSEARRVAQNARANKPLNGANDGFKGIFKVQGVRKIITTNPADGTRMVLFKINGFAFTEFNNTIYFNPYLIDPNQDAKNQFIYLSNLNKNWQSYVNKKGTIPVQNIIALLIQSFIGPGISDAGKMDKSGLKTPNAHFFIPDLVGALLGVKSAKSAKDIYNYLFGIQKYAAGSAASPATGFNPAGLSTSGRFLTTPQLCEGDTFIKPEYWNQVKTWAILNQFTNAPLNELYTCFRLDPSGKVMPTVVFRQIPFTTEDYKGGGSVTKFMNLPRWQVHSALVIDADLGREEAARVNFVQYFGKTTVGKEGADISLEIAQKNYVYDQQDVYRSGLRPYVVTSQFDEIGENKTKFRSPLWAKILADALFGGHLKMNGTINCAGIVDPIAVGDNLQFDGVVYHIEQIQHTCSYDIAQGRRVFRTVLSVSNGVSIDSNEKGTRYAEMNHSGGYATREQDSKGIQILPGVSEAQDVVYRKDLDLAHAKDGAFSQPKGGTKFGSLGKKGDSDE